MRSAGWGAYDEGVTEGPNTRQDEIRHDCARAGIVSRSYDHTDTGNAERLAALFYNEFHYVPAWGEYVVWDGARWRQDVGSIKMIALAKATALHIRQSAKEVVDDKKKAAILRWYKSSRARSRVEAMIALAKAEDDVAIDHSKLNRDPMLLNCRNGTIDLRTGKLKEHSPRNLLTQIIPFNFRAEAKAPKWERFLKEVVPDEEVRGFLQRYVGYCLTGAVTERMFVVLFGGGRNGKSVFLRVLQTVLGAYAISAAPTLLMARDTEAHPTEVADLFGVRLAIASEVKKGRVFDEEQVKRLTGNDTLKARRMREDFWEFDPTHKIILATNHKPRVKDTSDSFWDRIALVPFTVRIEKVNRNLLETLLSEVEGILAWSVRGCLLWQKSGLPVPGAVREATREYRESEDWVGKFVEERMTRGSELTITNEDLFRTSKGWCEKNNLFNFSERALAERLLEMGFQRATNIGPEKKRGWRGFTRKIAPVPSGDTRDTRDASGGITAQNARASSKRNTTPRSADNRDPGVSSVSNVSNVMSIDKAICKTKQGGS
jgi:putative DNA primase/helicase